MGDLYRIPSEQGEMKGATSPGFRSDQHLLGCQFCCNFFQILSGAHVPTPEAKVRMKN